mgnify:FL=1
MTEERPCLVCGNDRFTQLFISKDHLFSGETFAIRKCDACGFAFTADPPAEGEIGRYYLSEDYISHSDKKQNLTEYFYHLARNFMLRRKHRLVSEVTRKDSGTLLDIGSGTGYFASFMQMKGWKVTGIELNEQARNYSVTGLGITAVPPSEIINIPDKSTDCITFWHVIEHLYDPGMWMNEVRRILKDDGSCIIALPNLNSADAGWFGDKWAALDVPRHLWHFSPDTLIRFIEKCGFKCAKTRSLPLDIFYISALSYKNRGGRLSLVRGILTGSFLTAMSLFRKNSASSLIYVLSKQGS